MYLYARTGLRTPARELTTVQCISLARKVETRRARAIQVSLRHTTEQIGDAMQKPHTCVKQKPLRTCVTCARMQIRSNTCSHASGLPYAATSQVKRICGLYRYTGSHGQHCKTVQKEAHHCCGLSSIGELLHVQVGGGRWVEQGRWRLFGGAGPATCARPLQAQLAPRCELGLRRWR